MNVKKIALAAAVSAALAAPLTATADSDSGAASAVANLDFQVDIPSFVFFQIGDITNIDTVQFTLTNGGVPEVQTSPIVNVIVRSNAGDIDITADGTGAPLTSQGNPPIVIPWTEVTATAGTGDINPPVIAGGGSSTVTATNGIVDATDTWTFTFQNNAVYRADIYDGSVVFTAAPTP